MVISRAPLLFAVSAARTPAANNSPSSGSTLLNVLIALVALCLVLLIVRRFALGGASHFTVVDERVKGRLSTLVCYATK